MLPVVLTAVLTVVLPVLLPVTLPVTAVPVTAVRYLIHAGNAADNIAGTVGYRVWYR